MTYTLTPRAVRIQLLRQRRDQLDAEIRTLEAAETEPTAYEDCGTERAYKRHLRHGDRACRRCKDSHAAYTRDTAPGEVVCGSERAYQRHRYTRDTATEDRTVTCGVCVEAHAAHERRKAAHRAARKVNA